MVEQNSSLYLLVLLAISDHELHKSEAVRIKQIAEELKIEFDLYDAVAEIKSEFKNDFNTACDYYMSIIQDNRVKEASIEFLRELTDIFERLGIEVLDIKPKLKPTMK